ncbi:hypothetical protein Glove_152g9 [Diversispora epigaea]|uniref:ATPase AAA-type core domain-containing protein n=1 Tax=Diversispora epigaea TaxID=1348612 RepID=A0A397IZ05_9GLOM|nr:hypothetical protein Glove_152g9 [Diversispora epigaea]
MSFSKIFHLNQIQSLYSKILLPLSTIYNNLIKTIERNTLLEIDISNEIFPRNTVINQLKEILDPVKNQSSYHVVCGEHGTGKTTLVKIASKKVKQGVIYVNVPTCIEDFGIEFEKALNFAFKKRISFTKQLIRKLGSTNDDSDIPMWRKALITFNRVAKIYKTKYDKPAVIVYNNISQLIHEDSKILDVLQDDAKENVDKGIYIAVFICSEEVILRRMESRSSWSRAEIVIEIDDFSEEESMEYLTKKRKINEEVAKQLYNLVGGRIVDLKFVATKFIVGNSFEAKLLKNQKYYEAGKQVINVLLTSKEIDTNVFREIFTNEEEYDEVLKANVFAYHPLRGTVSFQSRSIEYYIQENPNIFVNLINLTLINEFNSNYASTSKL